MVFKTLTDLPHYQVNEKGDVYNKQTGEYLTPQYEERTGTYNHSIRDEKKTLSKLVYQYHGKYPSISKHFTLSHLDDDLTNDHIDNLIPKRVVPSRRGKRIFFVEYSTEDKEFTCYMMIMPGKEIHNITTFKPTEDTPKEFDNIIGNIQKIKSEVTQLEKGETSLDKVIENFKKYIKG